jgi:hypothetical protein
LVVKFGIRDDAWQAGKTDGVCFRVSGQDESGASTTIWERCLTPLTVEGDRGEQAAVLDLSHFSPRTLAFQTGTNGAATWDWSYWSEIRFIDP